MAPAVNLVALGLRTNSESYWIDLDLLLDELEAFGAKTLLLSAPFKGPYYDFWGVGLDERRTYYEMLRQVAARHHVALINVEAFDEDRYFVVDASSHLSAKAWVYYDRFWTGSFTTGR